jgi:hypothetical protein
MHVGDRVASYNVVICPLFLTQTAQCGAIMNRTEFQPHSWGRGWKRGVFSHVAFFEHGRVGTAHQ